MEFQQETLSQILSTHGADLIGYAYLARMLSPEEKYGVSVGVRLPKEIAGAIADGPSPEYLDTYRSLNAKLDEIVTAGASYLQDCGYHAVAQTTKAVKAFGVYRTEMPHKTVATKAGLGWIGKSALLITEEFGPAVRISSILTDAPLTTATPIAVSSCGDCTACWEACPAGAIKGKEWHVNLDRDEFYDALKCRSKAIELSTAATGEEVTLCGKCIAACPYTQKYLKNPD